LTVPENKAIFDSSWKQGDFWQFQKTRQFLTEQKLSNQEIQNPFPTPPIFNKNSKSHESVSNYRKRKLLSSPIFLRSGDHFEQRQKPRTSQSTEKKN
jgi:hypothetical protein